MSFPTFPNFTPAISLSLAQTIPLLLDTIAVEELALAHIINAEAEKTQFVLGTLTPTNVSLSPRVVTISDLLNVNTSVRRTLQDVIKKEMLLQFKFENTLDLIQIVPISGITPTPPAPCGCMATNQGGNNFDINRGTGTANTTVIVNGVTQPSNAHGSVSYNGHICLTCTSDNQFTFDYGGNATVPAFIFTATTFNVPHCPNQIVTITGQGTTNNPALFGANPVTYSLILNGVMNNKSISVEITGSNGTIFVATATNVANGLLAVTNCP
jgi:hypothetical protein